MEADIGLVGLAVMGQNLALNIHDHEFSIAVYNRTTSTVDEFLAANPPSPRLIGTHSLEECIKKLRRPRKLIIMVKAGAAVDSIIQQSLPYLESGDTLIDGGNSDFHDTIRRHKELEEKGIYFLGSGISGGEEGARWGPSIMPGGSVEGWNKVKPIFRSIAAKAFDGKPCCNYIGQSGAGHYVKMVHNGIEYGDMQLICEAYDLMHRALGASNEQLAAIFDKWNRGPLESYLIEITHKIFESREADGTAVVDKILDRAGQKGTGKWTVSSALDLGLPVSLIGEAVFARCLSALKDERVRASEHFPPHSSYDGVDRESFIQQIEHALYASKILSYAQGFMLMREAAEVYGWELDFGSIAHMWEGGCIIRSRFLGRIEEAYARNPKLDNLLLDPFFEGELKRVLPDWRRVVANAALWGIPTPCLAAALSFFDGYRSAKLPANLLQAQRDYFGAHQFERIDRPRGEFSHHDWIGSGAYAQSGTYTL